MSSTDHSAVESSSTGFRFRLSGKLVAAMTFAGLLPLIAVTASNLYTARSTLQTHALEQMNSIHSAKQAQIERYFEHIRNQVLTLSQSPATHDAMRDFKQAFASLQKDSAISPDTLAEQTAALSTYYKDTFGKTFKSRTGTQAAIEQLLPSDPGVIRAQFQYIAANPHPPGSKQKLDRVPEPSAYADVHARYHLAMRNFLEKFGYHDIFLIDPEDGRVVYSVSKELDFATSLLDGAYADTNFAEAFRRARDASPATAHIVDFEPYRPLYNAPASFIAAPIHDGIQLLGVLVFQMPVDEINAVMHDRAGLGETGETYLLGSDGLMRSQSFFSDSNTIAVQRVDTDALSAIVAGEHGAGRISDGRGASVLASYAPLDIDGLEWGVVAEISADEGFADVDTLMINALVIAVIALLCLCLTAWFLSRRMVRPIQSAVAIAEGVAHGKLDNHIQKAGSDEVGDLMDALHAMQANLLAREKLSHEHTATIQAMARSQSMVEYTIDGDVIAANQNFLDTMGYSLPEIEGQNHRKFVAANDSDVPEYQKFWRALGDGKHQTGEYRRISKDGEEVWFQASYNPILDRDGRVIKVVSYASDISEERSQRADQESLRREAIRTARLKHALDNVNANVMVADSDNNIIYLNDAIGEMFSVAEPEISQALPQLDLRNLVGSRVEDFYPNPAEQRNVLTGLSATLQSELTIGGRIFRVTANPVIGDNHEQQGTVFEWEDLTDARLEEQAAAQKEAEERVTAAANARIKQALDTVKASVMMADAHNQIIYLNDTAQKMFAEAERDIRNDLPAFNAGNLVGSDLNVFRTNPEHQATAFSQLDASLDSELMVGGRTFSIVSTPVTNDAGDRLGTVFEWRDRTQEIAVEEQLEHIVAAANAGDLGARIELDDKDGFLKRLSGGVNDMVSAVDDFLTDMGKVMQSIAAGDLSMRMTGDYAGSYAMLKTSTNSTIDKLDVMEDMKRVLTAISAGDLTQTIDGDYEGIFEELKQSANATVARLTEVVTGIKDSSTSLAGSSTELSRGSVNLSHRTESQASSLEETASSMEQMTSTVSQNAANANQANQLAMSARAQAELGGDVVGNAVNAMQAISESSKKISDIIGVIDEIAFQTNLLALNASVEAARAGEQGRGFAVVASEVRNLAGRSATAAREIKELIEDSAGKVDEGSRFVNESGETLDEIVAAVKKVTDIVAEIAAASHEQSSGIEQVNKAIMQMDEVTQQNAALVEESAAASEAVSRQSHKLDEMVDFFTIGDESVAGNPATAEQQPVQIERRGADRPWSQPPATASDQSPISVTPSAAVGGDYIDDESWEEF